MCLLCMYVWMSTSHISSAQKKDILADKQWLFQYDMSEVILELYFGASRKDINRFS